MNKKRLIATIVFVVLLVASTAKGTVEEISLSKAEWKESIYSEGDINKLALLEVNGVIIDGDDISSFKNTYNHQSFLKQLEYAFESKDIKGIVLKVNSPGGGVLESDEIYQKIVSLKKENAKPLVVYMDKYAASGGYYISAPADEIFANRNTITGSIGVIMSGVNYHEFAEKYGFKPEVIKSGTHKDMMNPMNATSEEERAILQSIIDESYGFFVDVVSEGRKLDKEKVKTIADGRIYSGTQAKEIGLVDEIGYLDDAIDRTAKLAAVKNPTVIKYEQSKISSLSNMFNSIGKPYNSLLEIEKPNDFGRAKLMYMYN